MKKILLLASLIILFIYSCTFKKGELPLSASVTFKCDSVVHYSTTMVHIVNTYCQPPAHGSGCHEAGGLRDYTNWTLLKAKVDNGSLLSRVVNLQGAVMPQTGPLPDSLRNEIHCWVIEGGPNN